jgi:hypothetical protein
MPFEIPFEIPLEIPLVCVLSLTWFDVWDVLCKLRTNALLANCFHRDFAADIWGDFFAVLVKVVLFLTSFSSSISVSLAAYQKLNKLINYTFLYLHFVKQFFSILKYIFLFLLKQIKPNWTLFNFEMTSKDFRNSRE